MMCNVHVSRVKTLPAQRFAGLLRFSKKGMRVNDKHLLA